MDHCFGHLICSLPALLILEDHCFGHLFSPLAITCYHINVYLRNTVPGHFETAGCQFPAQTSWLTDPFVAHFPTNVTKKILSNIDRMKRSEVTWILYTWPFFIWPLFRLGQDSTQDKIDTLFSLKRNKFSDKENFLATKNFKDETLLPTE